MATIGIFHKQDDGSYTGAIKTLTLNVKAATFRPVESGRPTTLERCTGRCALA